MPMLLFPLDKGSIEDYRYQYILQRDDFSDY